MNTIMHDNLYYPAWGTPRHQLPTPALLIDLPALEFNLSFMSYYFQNKSVKIRPHFKTHKCPIIARKQLDRGAVGITCAKLSEAEALVSTGISNILIANQVVDPAKIRRMVNLAGTCHLIVAIDHIGNLARIAQTAVETGNTMHVVIELDVGLHRAGVQPGKPALELADKASNLKGIHFSGLLGYEGFTMFEVDRGLRYKNVQEAMRALVDTGEMIRSEGIPVEIISAGGTGTYDLAGEYLGITEVEAGSYVFMDTKYNQLGLDFKQSLTLLSTVVSVPSIDRCIIDASMKVFTSDNGLPKIASPEGLTFTKINEEHDIVLSDPEKICPNVGKCVDIVPSYACTTVNLHNRYYVNRNDQLVDIWEITGRGKSQ